MPLKCLKQQFDEFAKKTKFCSNQTKHIRVFQDSPSPSPAPLNPQRPMLPRTVIFEFSIQTISQPLLPLKVGGVGGGRGEGEGQGEALSSHVCLVCVEPNLIFVVN